jgi:vacuolar iron transporter family protein
LSVDPVAEQVELAVSVQSGTARAAVLGINDGLVTNIALILGVVGASADLSVVRLAGLASLVAGACSMAAGEYISMRAQVELLERLLTEEREALARNPDRQAASCARYCSATALTRRPPRPSAVRPLAIRNRRSASTRGRCWA